MLSRIYIIIALIVVTACQTNSEQKPTSLNLCVPMQRAAIINYLGQPARHLSYQGHSYYLYDLKHYVLRSYEDGQNICLNLRYSEQEVERHNFRYHHGISLILKFEDQTLSYYEYLYQDLDHIVRNAPSYLY